MAGEGELLATLESTPANTTHWSRAKMAQRTGSSKSAIGRIWRTFELSPHRQDGFKVSNDPLFVGKVYDVVGPYLNPPERAVMLRIYEKGRAGAHHGDGARHLSPTRTCASPRIRLSASAYDVF